MSDMVVAEFEAADLMVAAAMRVRELGYVRLEALSPFPVTELDHVLEVRRSKVRWWVLGAGLLGAALALFILHWTNAVDYPLNVGGRPLDSYPADVPIVFETAVLFGAFASFGGVLLGSGLPRLHHPIYELEGFERTSIDRFWLMIGDVPSRLDAERAELQHELERMGAVSVRASPVVERRR